MNPQDRLNLHATMQLLLEHEPLVDYPFHDVRGPLDAATWALSAAQMKQRLAKGQHLQMDCSAGVACVYKWSGMQNPSGKYAVGWPGTTGTLLEARPHYSDPTKARVGAIVIFGPGTGEHAALVMDDAGSRDPWLWSHGFNGGPIRIRLSVERKFHNQPVTFLNVSGVARSR
jgi:hypothetical protein